MDSISPGGFLSFSIDRNCEEFKSQIETQCKSTKIKENGSNQMKVHFLFLSDLFY